MISIINVSTDSPPECEGCFREEWLLVLKDLLKQLKEELVPFGVTLRIDHWEEHSAGYGAGTVISLEGEKKC